MNADFVIFQDGVVPLAVGASATEQVYGIVLKPDGERLYSLPCYALGLAPNFGIPLTVYATLVDGNVL